VKTWAKNGTSEKVKTGNRVNGSGFPVPNTGSYVPVWYKQQAYKISPFCQHTLSGLLSENVWILLFTFLFHFLVVAFTTRILFLFCKGWTTQLCWHNRRKIMQKYC
jgi:hypothetical protein